MSARPAAAWATYRGCGPGVLQGLVGQEQYPEGSGTMAFTAFSNTLPIALETAPMVSLMDPPVTASSAASSRTHDSFFVSVFIAFVIMMIPFAALVAVCSRPFSLAAARLLPQRPIAPM